MPISMNIKNIFPIPIGRTKIERSLTDDELNILLNQQVKKNSSNLTSINTYVLDMPELSSLKQEIEKHLYDYFKTIYDPTNVVEIYITQSWINYNLPGMAHHIHAHMNSVISGVLYIQTFENRDNISFFSPLKKFLDIPANSYTDYSAEEVYIGVRDNDLIFFPSDICHGVSIIENGPPRISLAFNTFLTGKLGHEIKSSELFL